VVGEDDDDGAQAENAGKGRNPEQVMRDELMERMGKAGVGNLAVKTWCEAHGVKWEGKTVDGLAVADVEKLLAGWDAAVKEMKQATAKKSEGKPKAEPVTPTETEDGSEQPRRLFEPFSSAGMDPTLVNLMQADGITPAMLRAAITPKFIPESVALADLPRDFVATLTGQATWANAVKKMKGGAK